MLYWTHNSFRRLTLSVWPAPGVPDNKVNRLLNINPFITFIQKRMIYSLDWGYKLSHWYITIMRIESIYWPALAFPSQYMTLTKMLHWPAFATKSRGSFPASMSSLMSLSSKATSCQKEKRKHAYRTAREKINRLKIKTTDNDHLVLGAKHGVARHGADAGQRQTQLWRRHKKRRKKKVKGTNLFTEFNYILTTTTKKQLITLNSYTYDI